MAVNSLSPGFMKMLYSVNGREHQHNIGMVHPEGTPSVGTEPTFEAPSASVYGFDTVASDYADLVSALHNTATVISRAEYWYQPEPQDDPVFLWAATLNTAGQSSAPAVADGMLTITARTRGGGNMKLVFMETIFSKDYFDIAPIANTTVNDLCDYLAANNSVFVARDNTRLYFPLKGIGKANDALRKRRLNL